jgi:hypothetical protein
MNVVECIQSKKACFRAAIHLEEKPTLRQEKKEQAQERESDKKKRIESCEAECIQSTKARYEAVVQSEAKPKPERRISSDAECIQSEPTPLWRGPRH